VQNPRGNRQFNDLAISLLDSLSGRLKPTDYTPLEGENFFVARVPEAELALYTGEQFLKSPTYSDLVIEKYTRH
jgi:hypothetical protein